MKKLMAMVLAVVLVLGLSTTALAAATTQAPANGNGRGCGYGVNFVCSNYMWDADGNFVSRDVFEETLDILIEDGVILAENKNFYLERYDYCAEYGCGAIGVRGGGGCGGLGRGLGFGRNR